MNKYRWFFKPWSYLPKWLQKMAEGGYALRNFYAGRYSFVNVGYDASVTALVYFGASIDQHSKDAIFFLERAGFSVIPVPFNQFNPKLSLPFLAKKEYELVKSNQLYNFANHFFVVQKGMKIKGVEKSNNYEENLNREAFIPEIIKQEGEERLFLEMTNILKKYENIYIVFGKSFEAKPEIKSFWRLKDAWSVYKEKLFKHTLQSVLMFLVVTVLITLGHFLGRSNYVVGLILLIISLLGLAINSLFFIIASSEKNIYD